MDFFELAEKRYSVRKYTAEKLSQQQIDKLLHAANIAPTGCNNQPQRILVLNKEESCHKLKNCTRCHFDAPCAFIVCYNKNECWTRKYDGATSGIVDATIVATHVMLAAEQMGLGSCMVMHFDPAMLKQEFAIPENIEPVLILTLGYPAPDSRPLQLHYESKSIDQTVLYDSFEF